ncbi:N-acetylmuramoyl-L-alanine amidase [Maledivibacter halophilus]|uniref:N-acetylmuramoyl-L-alanine amidase n=1 Tax=Maledivibacter halophilus TaxID=36842 RepID=UPI0009A657C6|nr:N-acetylmuramoyl-L-alanine amidase [Maledivibacter halophilus]
MGYNLGIITLAFSLCSLKKLKNDIHRWYLERGWSGSGYHFLVPKDGEIHRGRPENTIGAHCKSHNTRSLGICVQGNYDVKNLSG